MTSRPPFSINEFVRARNAFDDGNGPAAAWTQINTISLWRLDELAERSGTRAWAILFAPQGSLGAESGTQGRLHQCVRSADLGMQPLRSFSRSAAGDVWRSEAVAVFEIDDRRAERLARRCDQISVLVVQRVPYERLELMHLVGHERIPVDRYDPVAIASALTHVGEAASVAIEYVPIGWFERLALYASGARRQSIP